MAKKQKMKPLGDVEVSVDGGVEITTDEKALRKYYEEQDKMAKDTMKLIQHIDPDVFK